MCKKARQERAAIATMLSLRAGRVKARAERVATRFVLLGVLAGVIHLREPEHPSTLSTFARRAAPALTLARGGSYCAPFVRWYAAAPPRESASRYSWARSPPAPCCCSWRASCWRRRDPTPDDSRCGGTRTWGTVRTRCASSAD